MEKVRYITYEQKLNISLDEAWEFFSAPENLEKITPPKMKFEIFSKHPSNKMFAGLVIQYIVRPLLGIPLKWVTEITHVKEKEYFVDEQRFGPYRFWHHLHEFRIVNGVLIMTDHLHYKLPMGLIGNFLDKIFVHKEIEKIFSYRNNIIEILFNKKHADPIT